MVRGADDSVSLDESGVLDCPAPVLLAFRKGEAVLLITGV